MVWSFVASVEDRADADLCDWVALDEPLPGPATAVDAPVAGTQWMEEGCVTELEQAPAQGHEQPGPALAKVGIEPPREALRGCGPAG
jgi:hypothetical protein